jgi:hypothetical protein
MSLKTITHNIPHADSPLAPLVMAARDAANQRFRETTEWRRVWMAGSKPGRSPAMTSEESWARA